MASRLEIPTAVAQCVLRAWEPRDKPALLRHADNRRVWRNLTEAFPHPYTEADADHWLVFVHQCAPSVHLAIDLAGEAVGGIGVIAGSGVSRFTGQFGYWLGEAHWGRGIATAAARAMAAHVFSPATRFERLEARVYAWNPASMRVLEKAGFVREGWLRRSVFKDGELVDSALYACLRSQPGGAGAGPGA